jgi:hypothetical protein
MYFGCVTLIFPLALLNGSSEGGEAVSQTVSSSPPRDENELSEIVAAVSDRQRDPT